MQYTVTINGTDVSDKILLTDSSIRKGINGMMGRADLTMTVEGTGRYDFAILDADTYSDGADVDNLDTVEIINSGTGAKIFSGYVARIGYQHFPTFDRYTLSCQDHHILLDTVLVNATYTSQTDAAIIASAFAALPEINLTNVTAVQTIDSFEAKDITLRQLLENLAEITGAFWYLDPDKKLYYKGTHFSSAPWAVSSSPDEVTTFPFAMVDFNREYTGRANRVKALGALNPTGGAELSVTVNDTAHQAEYGRIYSMTIARRDIDNLGTLTLFANTELAKRTSPRETGSLIVRKDGLDVGQGLTITAPTFGIASQTFTIREIEMKQDTDQVEAGTQYTVTFGDYNPKMVDLIRKFNTAPTKINQAIPPDGTISTDKVIDGAITNAKITSLEFSKVTNVSVTNSQIQSVDFSKVTNVSVTNSQIQSLDFSKVTNVSIDGNDIEDLSINNSHIANLTITGGKLQDNTITTAKIGSLQVTEAKIADGAITNAKINSLEVSKITGWEGGNINVGSGCTFSGSISVSSWVNTHSCWASNRFYVGAGVTPGVTGSFTTADGKTATFTGGILTGLA